MTTDQKGAIAEACIAAEAMKLGIDVCFRIPISLVESRPFISLPIEPCRNNQRRGINWADDFDLAVTLATYPGAVAQLEERRAGSA